MANLFERRDPWGNSPALWIIALMAFLLPVGWWGLKQTQWDHDVEHWLPPNHPQWEILAEARGLFPSDDRIIVSWDGSAINDPRVEKLIHKFQGVTDQYGIQRDGLKEIAGVIEPKDLLLAMQREDVEPQEAARRLQGVLLGSGPLKVRLTDAGRQRFRKTRADLGKAVRNKFNVRLEVLGPIENLADLAAIPLPTIDGEAPPQPAAAAVLAPDGTLITRASLDHDLQLVWTGIAPGADLTLEMVEFLRAFRWRDDQHPGDDVPLIEDCFFVLGSPIALTVSLSELGLAEKSQTLIAIRAAAETAGIPADALKLSGEIVEQTALNQLAAEALWNPAIPLTSFHRRSVILTSLLVGAALVCFLMRSLRLTILVLALSIFATALSLALIPATGGSMNLALAVIPALLLVISVSGGMHVINYWKHAAAENPRTAIAETCRTAAWPCGLAGIATAIALLCLGASGLTPVRNLGMYAAIGTVISLLTILYGLPSLLQVWPSESDRRNDLDQRGWRELGRWLTIRPGMQAAVFLAICAVCAIGLKNLRLESKGIRYFPKSSDIVQDYDFIENQLAGIVPIEVLVRFDPTAQEQANFVERLELVRSLEDKLRSHPEITGCLSLADFQPVIKRPPRDAGLLTTTRFHRQANLIEDRVRSGEIEQAATLYRQIPIEAGNSATAPNLIAAPGEELWRITAQALVMSEADYGQIVSDIERVSREVLRYQPGSQHVVTGAAPLILQTQQAAVKSLMQGFGLAFAVVLVVFMIVLRSASAGLAAMIPSVVPLAVTFGLFGWRGQRVDLGVTLTAAVALAIAVDGTVQFLTWFRRGLSAGLSRPTAIVRALEQCGPALWLTRIAITCGLLMLMPAELRLLSRFGWLTAAMAGVSLLANLVLLPQLLASPLGRLFEPPVRSDQSPPKPTRSSEVPPPHIPTANLRIPSR